MTIAEFHEWVNFLCDKDQADYFPPEEIDRALYRAIMWMYSAFVDASKDDNYNHTGLDPFRVSWFFQTTDFTNGLLALPANCEFVTGMQVQRYNNTTQQTEYYPLKQYRSDEIGDALRSQVCPVSESDPAVHITGKLNRQFYPKQGFNGDLFYLKKPTKPVFSYTMNGRVPVQDVNTSVNPEFAEPYMNDVAAKAVEYLGLNASSDELVQWSAARTATSLQSNNKS
jgi:hypothetical protein